MHEEHRFIFCRIAVLLLFTAALTFSAFYQTDQKQNYLHLTTEQKLADFDYLCSALDDGYPFWDDIAQAGIDKQEIYASYRKNIAAAKTDMDFLMCLDSFFKEFGRTGHLSIVSTSLYDYYFNALPDDTLQYTINSMQASNNPATEEAYRFLREHTRQSDNTSTKKDSSDNLTTSLYDDGKTAYLKINSFMITTTTRQQDEAALTDFYAQIKDTSNLIIDIRGNGGGSDFYWLDLIVTPNARETLISRRYFLFSKNETTWKYIRSGIATPMHTSNLPEIYSSRYSEQFPYYTTQNITIAAASHPYAGNIWLLVDDGVYSASENFAVFCKNTGFATLVGTPTGGDGGCIEPVFLSLPNSGLLFRFSTIYPVNADGTGNEAYGTTPDIVISDGEDALEKCLRLIEGALLPTTRTD